MKIVTVLGKVQDRIHNIKIFGSLNFDCVNNHEIVNGDIAKNLLPQFCKDLSLPHHFLESLKAHISAMGKALRLEG